MCTVLVVQEEQELMEGNFFIQPRQTHTWYRKLIGMKLPTENIQV
jgi:hypothetical protein